MFERYKIYRYKKGQYTGINLQKELIPLFDRFSTSFGFKKERLPDMKEKIMMNVIYRRVGSVNHILLYEYMPKEDKLFVRTISQKLVRNRLAKKVETLLKEQSGLENIL